LKYEGLSRPGVSGWLALLVVGLVVGFPLLGAGGINDGFLAAEAQTPELKALQPWVALKWATWSAFGAFALVSVYAGWGLARTTKWVAVRRAIVALWLIGPVSNITLNTVVPMITLGSLQSDAAEAFATTLLPALVTSLIAGGWTAYLLRSRRVRSIYVS
jgi:hypothetical protein